MIITDHAIRRYIKRHARHLSFAEAEGALRELAADAVPLKERSLNGQEQWKAGDLILVCKRDRGDVVCVTVLPDQSETDYSEEQLALMKEYGDV